MATHTADTPIARPKPTREEALAIAAGRKAVRARRTGRIRRWIAVVSVAAFVGPFGFIYTQLASGHDPALASQAVASQATAAASADTATSTASTDTTSDSDNSASTSTTTTTTSQSPAAVTTSQS
jgi:cytoskeletal protein RodZ